MSTYLDVKDLKALERTGKRKGSLKLAQMIRVAISDYVTRNEQAHTNDRV